MLPRATTLFQDLNALVDDINTQAVNKKLSIRAKNDNGRLILETDGKTIGVQVETSASAGDGSSATASFDLSQIFGSGEATVSSAHTGSGMPILILVQA
jgi:hypothetical protein